MQEFLAYLSGLTAPVILIWQGWVAFAIYLAGLTVGSIVLGVAFGLALGVRDVYAYRHRG